MRERSKKRGVRGQEPERSKGSGAGRGVRGQERSKGSGAELDTSVFGPRCLAPLILTASLCLSARGCGFDRETRPLARDDAGYRLRAGARSKTPLAPATRPFVPLEVEDLTPGHGEGVIGVGDAVAGVDRACRVLGDAPVLGGAFGGVAPIGLWRVRVGGCETRPGGPPPEPKS